MHLRHRNLIKGVSNLVYIIICIFGLLIGSFLNVCIYRIPKGESIAFPPSHCSRCNHSLSALDLIPVVSYLALKGRCRYCKEKISPQYPIVETLVSVLFLLTYLQYGYTFQGLAALIMVCLLVVVAFIDLNLMIIPNRMNLIIAGIGILVLFLGWGVTWKDSFLGGLIGGGILLLLGGLSSWLLHKEGMGGGDIKLMAACGLYLGVVKVVWALMISVYIAGAILIVMLVSKKLKRDQQVSFGPFLSAGTIFVILFYDKLF